MTIEKKSIVCERDEIAKKANLFLEVMSKDENSIQYEIKSRENNQVELDFEVLDFDRNVDTYKLVKVLQVQIVTLDYVNVVSSLQKMYPVNEGYRISVVARVPHDIFTSDIIVNVYSGQKLKKKRKVEL